jgi:hypothetical protein
LDRLTRLPRWFAIIVALAATTVAPSLRAQVDTGRVEPLRLIGILDARTGDWINRATVRDTLGTETQTTRYGVATLNVLTPIAGFYLLEIRKEGYLPRRVRLRADTAYQIMFALEPNPLGDAAQLPAVVTTARQQLQSDAGQSSGFFERCQVSSVQCVGRVDLDRRPTANLDAVLAMKTGLHRDCRGKPQRTAVGVRNDNPPFDDELTGCLIQMRAASPPPTYCTPTYFVDGYEWFPFGGPAQGQVDRYFPPKRITGIEVYLTNEPIPPRFSTSFFTGCGAIVVWTR